MHSSDCVIMTLTPNPLQQRFTLQTITVNSFHIWQSWRTTYKWYASPAGPMATALTLLLRFFDPRQALIHFSFTLLAKHIMWIWSFVPDRPCLTSLSPQAPDASQRSCGGGEEFHGIQRLCRGCFWLLRLPFLCLPPAPMLTCSSWSHCQAIFLALRDRDCVP